MSRLPTNDIGAKYAPDDRLLILHASAKGVSATVPGAREVHAVTWSPVTNWACTCTARTSACGHILAVRRVVVLDPGVGQ